MIKVPENEITFKFSRSGGAGGQNVNKVNSRVTLEWMPSTSSLPAWLVTRIISQNEKRINKAGELQIHCDRSRDQARNRITCLELLSNIVERAQVRIKQRIKAKPPKRSKESRLKQKRHRSSIKAARNSVDN